MSAGQQVVDAARAARPMMTTRAGRAILESVLGGISARDGLYHGLKKSDAPFYFRGEFLYNLGGSFPMEKTLQVIAEMTLPRSSRPSTSWPLRCKRGEPRTGSGSPAFSRAESLTAKCW